MVARGPAQMRITAELEPLAQRIVAFHTHLGLLEQERTIYLDGRPHPSEYAEHSFAGFSTGVWEGNMLTITTTHLAPGYLRRNGVPRSDKAVVTEHWVRHGNYLTIVSVIDDPAFLSEPIVRSSNYALDPGQHLVPFDCDAVPEVERPEASLVPHYLPGKNPFLSEFADNYGLPVESVRGGAETLLPEFRKKLGKYSPPALCKRYCNCMDFNCNR
jgi:hypothetical protein